MPRSIPEIFSTKERILDCLIILKTKTKKQNKAKQNNTQPYHTPPSQPPRPPHPQRRGGGRKRLPKFKFSAKFPIGLHVILQIQIKKIRK